MLSNRTHDQILRVIQQFEILRRETKDFDEGVRLQEMINEMKQKLADAINHK